MAEALRRVWEAIGRLCGRPVRAAEAHTDLVRAGNTAHVACAEAWQRERDAHQRAAAARGGSH
jgi:hypothetical protein